MNKNAVYMNFYDNVYNSDAIKNIELFSGYWETDPNNATHILTAINGWSENLQNTPNDFYNCWGLLITIWYHTEIGSLTAIRYQSLLYNEKCSSRYYNEESGTWTGW